VPCGRRCHGERKSPSHPDRESRYGSDGDRKLGPRPGRRGLGDLPHSGHYLFIRRAVRYRSGGREGGVKLARSGPNGGVLLQLEPPGRLKSWVVMYVLGVSAIGIACVVVFAARDLAFGLALVAVGVLGFAIPAALRPAMERRAVASIELTAGALIVATRGGRVRTIPWSGTRWFLDVYYSASDGTTAPAPVLGWGRVGLPHTRLSLDSALVLVSTAKERGLAVRESVSGAGPTRLYTAEIRTP
jgi:hypothetical protein